ncbi:MAG: diaminopimelate epimerase [Actinobacteria bacterium]|nr:diaminopimelate epimerase [Actinomycetota bacterium]
MRFWKWHGLGNAYLVVERPDRGALEPARVRRLCNVGTGIGSDGVIEVVARTSAEAEIVIWNPDGSVAEMSGNGVRIAARWLAMQTGAREVVVVTGGRRVHARMLEGGDVETDIGEVEIGAPETIDLGDGEAVELTPVSVGNPHAVVRRDGATRGDLLLLGPRIETHPRFPNRTNVQLVEPVGANELRVLVWERGAGETASSGSSSTAAAAVAVARSWCVSPVTVHLPGGDLVVTLAGSFATLLGPAEQICEGVTAL